MKFTLKAKDLFSHLVLNNREIATSVSETKEWEEDGTLDAKLTVNGINIPPENLDNLLHKMWEQVQIDSGKEAFEAAVEKRALKLFDEQKNTTLSALTDLHNKIEMMEATIKFPWED